jgi:hypothetical protein
LHFWGEEEFPASKSVPTLMVLNKDRKYFISLFFQLFLWFILGQPKKMFVKGEHFKNTLNPNEVKNYFLLIGGVC